MWKEIKGYEGYYEVSDDGRVRSVDRYVTKSDGVIQLRHSREMTLCLNTDGYPTAHLSKDGVSKRLAVHRLVAETFMWIDGCDSLEVNHIDFDRTNNRISNLEWVTHKENITHTKSHKRHVSDRDLTGKNNPNYGNDTLHRRYEKDKDYAKEKQSRPGSQNGRAKSIQLECNGNKMVFGYISECAKFIINNGYINSKSITSLATRIRKAAESGKSINHMSFRLL